MDGTWDPKLWIPTGPGISLVYETESDKINNFERLSNLIIDLTKKIKSKPTDSSFWLARAIKLSSMGYFDLAAGDAWKAVFLVECRLVSIDGISAHIGDAETKIRMNAALIELGKAYYELTIDLMSLQDYRSVLEICDEGIVKYGAALRKLFSAVRATATNRTGGFGNRTLLGDCDSLRKAYDKEHGEGEYESSATSGGSAFLAYPFMPVKYLSRQDDVIRSSKQLFQAASKNCQLSNSSVRRGDVSHDVFGVFATRDIISSEELFTDPTPFAASKIRISAPNMLPESIVNGVEARVCDNCYGNTFDKISLPCCKRWYCSRRCRDIAVSNYHTALCGKDFSWLYEECSKMPQTVMRNGPLWLRILATCVQSGLHPLDHPAIARLTPNYVMAYRKWSFANMVRQPFLILKQLGINPFKDCRYDGWVLHTIWARVLNNQGHLSREELDGGRLNINSINPLYSFFNHNCEPNAKSKSVLRHVPESCYGGSTRVMYATKKIKKGEEICIDYGGFNGIESKAQRYAQIASWMNLKEGCGCRKCRSEP